MTPFVPEGLREVQQRMRATAERLRLGLEGRAWSGRSGAVIGSGAGSSIEYHDHRPFLLGDDPRNLDWRAYARTGQYTLKVYREEVSPRVDLVLDVSASMWLDDAKARRTVELLYFCIEAALRARATLACFAVTESNVAELSLDALAAGEWPELGGGADRARAPDLARVPWRARSLRLWISDLLFEGEAAPALAGLARPDGRAVIFAPYCLAEANPDWSGSCELTDVEGSARLLRHVDARSLARYRAAYARHFDLWRDACRRRATAFVRVAGEGAFEDALCAEALPAGVVALWT